MSINFRESKKEYVVLTPEDTIRRSLRSLGYKNTYILDGELLKEDVDFLSTNGKSVLFMYYDEQEIDLYDAQIEMLKSSDVKSMEFNLFSEYEYEKDELSLEEFILKYCKRERIEQLLIRRKMIHKTDYENRCGNCRSHLRGNAKYCDKCGTKVGEGTYEPFYDEVNLVYGPPVKIRHKCKECNFVWITAMLGGDRSNYCPKCGTKDIRICSEEVRHWDDYEGVLEPIDYETESSVLLEENAVEELVSSKGRMKKIDPTLKRVFKKIGLSPVDKRKLWHLTERQAEQNNLGRRILRATGNNPKGDPEEKCPWCGRTYKGYYAYTAYLSRDEKYPKEILCNTKDSDYITEDGGHLALDFIDPATQPAFFCLQCACNYGRLKIDGKVREMESIGKTFRKDH